MPWQRGERGEVLILLAWEDRWTKWRDTDTRSFPVGEPIRQLNFLAGWHERLAETPQLVVKDRVKEETADLMPSTLLEEDLKSASAVWQPKSRMILFLVEAT